MAHEFEKGFFVGKPAWHGLGITLDNITDIDQAYRLAFGFHIVEKPLSYNADSVDTSFPVPMGMQIPTRLVEVDTHKALVRSDNNKLLAVVGRDYKVLQPYDQCQWFKPILDTGLFELETGLTLKHGKRLVLLAKVKGKREAVIEHDYITQYLLLCQGTDGTLAVRVMPTNIRVVCMNTLSLALDNSSISNCVRISHTSGMTDRLAVVQQVITQSAKTFDNGLAQYRAIAAKPLTTPLQLEDYCYRALDVDYAELVKGKKEPLAVDKIKRHYAIGAGSNIPGVTGTYWGAYNAVTEYIDHTYGRNSDNRTNSALFGVGATIKQRALDVALAA